MNGQVDVLESAEFSLLVRIGLEREEAVGYHCFALNSSYGADLL